MRILMVSWEYPPHIVGGLGMHVAELAPALAAQGLHAHVITPLLRGGEQEESHPSGIWITRVALPQLDHHNFVSFVTVANQEIERAAIELAQETGGFHLIHTHDWLTAIAAIALKQRWHIPLIATIHATERGRGRGMLHGDQSRQIDSLEWQLSYEAWRVIVCSRFMARQVMDTFHTPSDKIDVVRNGTVLRPNPFQNAEERQQFRRTYATDQERIIFYVGRIVYEKGMHVLLDAMPRLLEHMPIRAVIAGTGPYLDMLKSQADAMRINQYVTFTGFISDEERDKLYHVADVATFPSLYEPFGIVALEAYAAGCPVVVSQTGGLMEVVRSQETGITVLPGNAESLAWGILTTLQKPDETYVRVARALKEVREEYDWLCIARETNTVYERVYKEWQASSWGREDIMAPEGTMRLAG